MNGFKVVIHRKAVKELKNLPKDIRDRILESLEEMKISPFIGDVRKIRGEEAYRKRVGDYRIEFIIDLEDNTIAILRIVHRKRIYKK
ncbi:MAG TPA: type II toxin-antitoxin system RelE/ParE family toxin [Nitrososphaeria archaeon]|nr:type II toxin-antitoxin system RelE/ParE family toxin [Nitrososphaeria archaeon]